MNSDKRIIPEWIKAIKDQDDLKAAKDDAATQRKLLAEKTVQADGPAFWRQLLKDLQLAVDGLPLIGLRASMTNEETTAPNEDEVKYIEVSNHGSQTMETHTHVRYQLGEMAIRCYPRFGDAVNFQLCVRDGQILAVSSASVGSPMNAERCAHAIIHPMVREVKN